jgi:hypothetical protein
MALIPRDQPARKCREEAAIVCVLNPAFGRAVRRLTPHGECAGAIHPCRQAPPEAAKDGKTLAGHARVLGQFLQRELRKFCVTRATGRKLAAVEKKLTNRHLAEVRDRLRLQLCSQALKEQVRPIALPAMG